MDLSVRLAHGKIKMKNPLMPASGPLTGSADRILETARFNTGAIVTKTICPKPPASYYPFMYGEKNILMNTESWSEYSPAIWEKEFLPDIKSKLAQPLFVSLGYTEKDMQSLIPAFEPYADAFEISTHYVGKDMAPIRDTVKMIRALTQKPFYLKISPHFPEPEKFAATVVENGAEGIVAMNSLGPAMTVDLEKRRVRLGNSHGEAWMSGPAVKPVALALIHRIKRAVPDCEVIGTGGVESPEDVVEFLLAGADAVQMLSAALLRGKELYGEIIKKLPGVLKKYNFESVQEVCQTPLDTHSGIENEKIIFSIDQRLCSGCGRCEACCPSSAIYKTSDSGGYQISKKRCLSCGLCSTRCPRQAVKKMA